MRMSSRGINIVLSHINKKKLKERMCPIKENTGIYMYMYEPNGYPGYPALTETTWLLSPPPPPQVSCIVYLKQLLTSYHILFHVL